MSARQRSKPWTSTWPLSVVVNASLGYLGIFPFLFLQYVLSNTVFYKLGWTEGDPTFNDGALIPFLLAAVGTLVMLALFAALNYLIVRAGAVAARWYWSVSAVVLLIPFVLINIWPELWSAIKWY